MINESQSDSESITQIAKAPHSIEQVHVSASEKKEKVYLFQLFLVKALKL